VTHITRHETDVKTCGPINITDLYDSLPRAREPTECFLSSPVIRGWDATFPQISRRSVKLSL
jgi:hypothetical protein